MHFIVTRHNKKIFTLRFRRWLFLIFLYSCFTIGHSQQVENVRFQQEGKFIHIYYDLKTSGVDAQYSVQAFCSTDGGITWGSPLKNVTGQVGNNQTQGLNKKITWDVLAERDKLEGNILFEVRATTLGSYGTFKDPRDGKVYKTIKIGDQVWMAENLAWLPKVSPPSAESYNKPYYYVYGYSGRSVSAAKATSNFSNYGVLYNWPAAMNACPQGWHLPTDAEWTTLENYLIAHGYNYDGTTTGNKIGKALASAEGWKSPSNTGAVGNSDYPGKRNASGFSALPGGDRYFTGHFSNAGNFGFWWSATESGSSDAWYRFLYYDRSDLYRYDGYREYGFSVRCLRDN